MAEKSGALGIQKLKQAEEEAKAIVEKARKGKSSLQVAFVCA